MAGNDILIGWESLWRFTRDVFVGVGLSTEDAGVEADVLVWANLRGVDSHGVQAVPRYVKQVKEGFINLRADVRIARETPAMALVEADRAFGPVVTVFAMEQALRKAAEVGIGWVLIRNTTHQGAMGYYALMAAKRDMAGLAWVCNPPNMAPYGAKAAGVHNSPIAIAVPGKERPALLLDMATSVAAWGKVSVAIDKGESIPPTWAMDRYGKPTTDPREAATLLPAGGYKGYGLALMFECLSSLMVGNPLLAPTLLGLDGAPPPGLQNSVVAAVNIGAMTDVEGYKAQIDDLACGLQALPTIEGFERVLLPGEPEDRVAEVRREQGIPLPVETFRRLREVADDLQVEMPEALR